MPPVNQVQFSKMVGVSKARVSNAIRQGLLKRSVTVIPGGGRGGQDGYAIDPELGVAEWQENRDLKRAPDPAQLAVNKLVGRQIKIDPEAAQRAQQNKERKDKADADLAELNYRLKAGELVEARTVEKAAFNRGRLVREAILNVPGRLAAELAVMSDAHAIEMMLRESLGQALEELADAG